MNIKGDLLRPAKYAIRQGPARGYIRYFTAGQCLLAKVGLVSGTVAKFGTQDAATIHFAQLKIWRQCHSVFTHSLDAAPS